jgi:hypothetical protein
MCWATGWNYVIPIPDKKAITVATALHNEVFLKHCVPSAMKVLADKPMVMVSDNGTEFCNQVMASLIQEYNLKHIRTTPFSPKGNSLTENRHRFYNMVLRIATKRYGINWVRGIYFANFALNIKPFIGTHHSPFELLYGYKPLSPADIAIQHHPDFAYTKKTMPEESWIKQARSHAHAAMEVVDNARRQLAKSNDFHDDKVRYTRTYSIGDLVLLWRPIYKKGISSRLLYQTIGPYEVVGHPKPNIYSLVKLGTKNVDEKASSHNVSEMCPYITKEHYEEQQEKAKPPAPDATGAAVDAAADAVAFDPQSGDFLLLPNFGGTPYHLCKVTDVNGDRISFHYYNTTSPKRLNNFRPCWQHAKLKEAQSLSKPKLKGYTPMTDTIQVNEFCQMVITTKLNKAGHQLTKTNVDRVLLHSALD